MSGAPKYDRLVTASQIFDVPPMTLLGWAEMTALWPGLETALARLDRLSEEIAQTKGCYIDNQIAEIGRVLDGVRPAPDAAQRIAALMAARFGAAWGEGRFAVRSAGGSEDLDGGSFAGVYHSVLNVEGAEAILHAAWTVWRSAYGEAALFARLSQGALGPGNPMSVILQVMVPADCAGVAFSTDPTGAATDIVVESVAGLGDRLVDGSAASDHRAIPRAALDAKEDTAHRVARLALALEEHLGQPVDIEWAMADDRLWLLQVRPVTGAGGPARRSAGPVLDWAELYGDDADRLDALGPLPEFARYFRAKRKRIYDFGRRNRLAASTALTIRANRLGLDTEAAGALIAAFTSDELVLDLNDNLRQVILPKADALDRIARMMTDPEEEHCFVLRDFVRGALGLISERLDDAVFVEWSADGLLAINRGTAHAATCRIAGDGQVTGQAPPLAPERLIQLHRATLSAQAEIGSIRIEWVAGAHGLLAVDFSDTGPEAARPTAQSDIVSHGYARAPLMHVAPDAALTAISVAASVSLNAIPEADEMGAWFGDLMVRVKAAGEPPIVVVDRPYAALAALIPHVAGFVFENASVLCHLAILLRERGLPAVQSPAHYRMAQTGHGVAELETRGAGLRLIDTPAEAPAP